ncbi:MAG: penicillin-binding protein 2 [Pseudomonadales bacterium]|nr:penicillin-binding protein 2 [Pseudomonadales bacterium]
MLASLKFHWRFAVVAAFLMLLFAVLVIRMMLIQVVDIDGGLSFLQGQGKARTVRMETIPANRGMITDRNGQPLAVSTPVVTIWANPKKMQASPEQIRQLAKLLEQPYQRLHKKLQRYKNKQFVYIQRKISPALAEAVFALKISGIYGREEYRRFYPAGEVTSQLLGFTNVDNVGQEGFELAYDSWLQGSDGSRKVVKDLFHRTIKVINHIEEAKPGNDLVLSIDLRLQYLAYKELKSVVKHHRADGGTAVILDVHSGEVLAMVNQPSFNPNDRRNMEIASVRNRALTDVFEPGSTVKPIAVMAALESGKVHAHSKIDTRPGYVKVGRKTLLDPVNYGVIDVTKVITKSSQVGMTKIALSLDQETIPGMYMRMGFGQYLQTGFPGERTGRLPERTKWRPIERATLAFGNGVSVTALQLAQAYAIMANHGEKIPVSLLLQDEIPASEKVVDAQYADAVLEMLKTVVKPGGTAKKAQTESYSVAGKTGTSHKVGRRGYEDGKYLSLFAGMAPADNPRLVAVIVVDDPKGKEYYGGEVAAPVFSKIMSGSLRMLNVVPDKLTTNSPSAVSRSNYVAGR